MSDSVYDIDPNNPKFETSREPKYKHVEVPFAFEDNNDSWFGCVFTGGAYEYNDELRFAWGEIKVYRNGYNIDNQDLINIFTDALRDHLGLSLRQSIIFESKIELK